MCRSPIPGPGCEQNARIGENRREGRMTGFSALFREHRAARTQLRRAQGATLQELGHSLPRDP
jgi:hypothetical protein